MRSELFHLVLLLCAVVLAAISLPFSFKHHRRLSPALCGACGLALLALAGAFHGPVELALSLGGGGLLMAAHLFNRRLLMSTPLAGRFN